MAAAAAAHLSDQEKELAAIGRLFQHTYNEFVGNLGNLYNLLMDDDGFKALLEDEDSDLTLTPNDRFNLVIAQIIASAKSSIQYLIDNLCRVGIESTLEIKTRLLILFLYPELAGAKTDIPFFTSIFTMFTREPFLSALGFEPCTHELIVTKQKILHALLLKGLQAYVREVESKEVGCYCCPFQEVYRKEGGVLVFPTFDLQSHELLKLCEVPDIGKLLPGERELYNGKSKAFYSARGRRPAAAAAAALT